MREIDIRECSDRLSQFSTLRSLFATLHIKLINVIYIKCHVRN